MGYPSYIIPQKLRLLKDRLKDDFGKSNLQLSIETAQAALLDVQG